jgi:hypothetical protein
MQRISVGREIAAHGGEWGLVATRVAVGEMQRISVGREIAAHGGEWGLVATRDSFFFEYVFERCYLRPQVS